MNLNNILATYWKQILIAIGFAIVLFLVFKECTPKTRIAPMPDPIVKIVEVEKDAKKWQDSLKTIKMQLDSSRRENKKTEMRLIKSQGEVKTWISRYESARQYNDTIGAILACDSLVEQNHRLMTIIDEEREESRRNDSLWSVALSASDSAALKQTRIASDMRIIAQNAVSERNKIAVDFNKQNKQLRNAQGGNKILAGIGGVLATIIILK